MSWITLTLTAATIWASIEVTDNIIVNREIDNIFLDTSFSLSTHFLILTIGAIIFSGHSSFVFSWYSLIITIFYFAAILTYYRGLKFEEVSRFGPSLSTTTIFIVIFAYLFLGETFNLIVYLGIACTLSGAFLISLKKPLHSLSKLQSKAGFLLAILASSFFAGRELLFKYSSGIVDFWSLMFWIGVFGFLFSLILMVFNLKQIKQSKGKGLRHLLILGIFNGIGYFLYLHALNSGPVSLVAAIAEIDMIIIFTLSVTLGQTYPKLLEENFDHKQIIQKIMAILLSFTGVIIIHIYS